jgi:hypothetical protein
MEKKPKPRPRLKKLVLHPLTFDEAVSKILKSGPMPKPPTDPKQEK